MRVNILSNGYYYFLIMLVAKNLEKRAQIIELSPGAKPAQFKCEKCLKSLNPIPISADDSLIVEGLYRNACPSCKTINYYKVQFK
ncbi:hypothetical protein ST37_06600 [Vibrio sp. qd031]|nr:hypothetical protein ST37_06600 [Vibrio sp. qd031]